MTEQEDKEQFEKGFANSSGMTVEEYRKDYITVRCTCKTDCVAWEVQAKPVVDQAKVAKWHKEFNADMYGGSSDGADV